MSHEVEHRKHYPYYAALAATMLLTILATALLSQLPLIFLVLLAPSSALVLYTLIEVSADIYAARITGPAVTRSILWKIRGEMHLVSWLILLVPLRILILRLSESVSMCN